MFASSGRSFVTPVQVVTLLLSTGKDEGEEQAGAAAPGNHQGVGDAGGREDQGRGAGVAPDHGQEMGRLAQELHPGTGELDPNPGPNLDLSLTNSEGLTSQRFMLARVNE